MIQFSTVNQVREEQRLDIYLVSKNHLKKEEEHLALVFFFCSLLVCCYMEINAGTPPKWRRSKEL